MVVSLVWRQVKCPGHKRRGSVFVLPLSLGLAGCLPLTRRATVATFTAPRATLLLNLSGGYPRRMDVPDVWIYPSDGYTRRMDVPVGWIYPSDGYPGVWIYPSDGYPGVWAYLVYPTYGYYRPIVVWIKTRRMALPASRPGEGQPGDVAASSAAAGSPKPGETKQRVLRG